MEHKDIFKCQKCGECCKGYGGTYVNDEDIKLIADYIGVDVETFINKYCQISCKRYIISQGKNDYCIFWDKICTIHPVKPSMCKAWPFIKSVLIDPKNWEIMANSCPGIAKNCV